MRTEIYLDKINELFDFRQIPYLLELTAISGKPAFLKKLMTLQQSIYELDHYLESVWEVKDAKLADLWDNIYQKLSQFGISTSNRPIITRQILRYQINELSTRKGKSPTRYSMRYFYYYKTCDVRLMRNLIYLADPDMKRKITPASWLFFDLATEINDDISDFQEDAGTYNVNKFRHEVLEQGLVPAKSKYSSFLDKVDSNASEFFRDKNSFYGSLYNTTKGEIKSTKSILAAFKY